MIQRVVLVGAGHAHLHVAAQARQLIEHGAQVTLVAPATFWYSGRATAMLGGAITAQADQIDAGALVEAAGGRFVEGCVTGLDRDSRQVMLADGNRLDYDWLSFNVGSVIDDRRLAFAADDRDIWPVKPIADLVRLNARLSALLENGETPRVTVIGGGATGCEVAFNLVALAERYNAKLDVRLLHAGARLAQALPPRASRRLTDRLRARGVDIRLDVRVSSLDGRTLCLDDGQRLDVDTLVVATGLRAPNWLARLGLSFDDGLTIDPTLRVIGDTRIFASGDCAHLQGFNLPRLGVFGVRQAPILLHNLQASLTGAPMTRYRPQSRWLSILELGDGTGLAVRGRLWWHGRASRWLKHRLDRQFLERYRQRA